MRREQCFRRGRRKWTSERKGHPLPDIMKAGGWKDARSLEAYLQDDAKTTYEVVSQPTAEFVGLARPSATEHAQHTDQHADQVSR